MKKAVEVRDEFIKNVVSLLNEHLTKNTTIKYSVPDGDGWGDYLFKDKMLYVGGAYGYFAGEYSDPSLSDESSRDKPSVGVRVFNEPNYDMSYTLEQVEKHMSLSMATRVLHIIIRDTP